jgi:hypothetical protein
MKITMSHVLLVGTLVFIGRWSETPVRAQAVAFQPVVTPFPSGVGLDVTPSVSADRRYVRMGIGVSFTSLLGFDTYSVPAAVSGGMNGAIGGLGGGGMGMGGGGGGFRAAGLGQTRAAGADQGLGFGPIAGDPFARAAEAPSHVPARAAAQAPMTERDPAPVARPSRGKVNRGRVQGAPPTRKTRKSYTRTARANEGGRDGSDAGIFPEVFPFDP